MSNSTALEVLRAAREKIARPGCWTRRAYARDATGRAVLPMDPMAVCWCIRGAIQSIHGDIDGWAIVWQSCFDDLPLATFNDHPKTSHADVVAAFDRAIAKLGGAPF
jgi:hypothetical protein